MIAFHGRSQTQVLCYCCDLILAVGAADGRGVTKGWGVFGAPSPQVGGCVHVRSSLARL